jgi:K+-sensing histidine kinase KdpD
MVTSAEKRKWRRLSQQKLDPKLLEEEEAILRNARAEKEQSKKSKTKESSSSSSSESSNAHPFFFLVVFPVLLTSLVVLSREDLREELDQEGFVKLIKDWSRVAPTLQQQNLQTVDVRQLDNHQ